MNNTHYICTGECSGVSAESGSCNTEICSNYGEALQACTCDASEHQIAPHNTSTDISLDDGSVSSLHDKDEEGCC